MGLRFIVPRRCWLENDVAARRRISAHLASLRVVGLDYVSFAGLSVFANITGALPPFPRQDLPALDPPMVTGVTWLCLARPGYALW